MSKHPAHLEQDKLVSSKAAEALSNFDARLRSAEFAKNKEDNFEHCVDKGLDEASQSLLKDRLCFHIHSSSSSCPKGSSDDLRCASLSS